MTDVTSLYWQQLAEFDDLQLPDKQFQLDWGQGRTQLQPWPKTFVLHEEQNPTGSIKDRGLAWQVSHALSQGRDQFVISSSGNAAASAAKAVSQADARLVVFVSPNVNQAKLAGWQKLAGVEVKFHPRPRSAAWRWAQQTGAYNLQASRDDQALVGYRTLAVHLYQQLQRVPDWVVMPVSSGAGLLGMMQGWQGLKLASPRVLAVQTAKIHPLAAKFDHEFEPVSHSLADGIVLRSNPRLEQLVEVVASSGGSAVAVSDQQIRAARQARKHFRQADQLGWESWAAWAGYDKFFAQTSVEQQTIVVISTGRMYG